MEDSNLKYGKLPPQSIELEEAVIGACMLDKDALEEVITILDSEMFYNERHIIIFSSIKNLYDENKNVDLLTVIEQLKKTDNLDIVGGPFYLSQLLTKVISGSHAEYHAMIIKEKYYRREIIRISTEIQKIGYDRTIDFSDLMNYAETELFNLTNKNESQEAVHISKPVEEVINLVYTIKNSKDELTGIASGSITLDRLTGGWQNGDMIIIAARPSMGKTAIALNFAIHAASNNIPVLFFSLEMSNRQLATRLLSYETEINQSIIRDAKKADVKKLEDGVLRLESSSLYVDDTSSLKVTELRSKCRKYIKKYGIRLVVIDYMQLMDEPTIKNRFEKIGYISRSIKGLAKQLDIPIISLAQLNREAEGKIPSLSNLREAGDIEQDADLVIFPCRNEKLTVPIEWESNSILAVSKHRNGAIGRIQTTVSEDVSRWEDFIQIQEVPF